MDNDMDNDFGMLETLFWKAKRTFVNIYSEQEKAHPCYPKDMKPYAEINAILVVSDMIEASVPQNVRNAVNLAALLVLKEACATYDLLPNQCTALTMTQKQMCSMFNAAMHTAGRHAA